VRFLLGNYVADYEERIDFHTVHGHIPEVTDLDGKTLSRPRFVKSHAPQLDAYPNIIYIVRDPRDVYVSRYHYQGAEDTDFSEFLQDGARHPRTWAQHVTGWLQKRRPNQDLLLVHYEDLKTDAQQELRRMIRFADLPTDENRIRHAVERSSFENMKRLEGEYGRPGKSHPNVFTRKGKKGQWTDYFSDDDLELLRTREGEAMELTGYA
jgi:hypothetical protein